ncbi:MAG: peptidylprolyl isomerase [Longimicrobiales bacterium]
MSAADDGTNVSIHYTGRLSDGSVFDTSEGGDPLDFEVGAGQVIPGFENAVKGMEAGQEKTVTVPALDAYGPRRQELLLDVSRDQLPDGMTPEVGQQLHMQTQEGQTFQVRVLEVHDESLKLDANHPLAGEDLTFDILLVAVA